METKYCYTKMIVLGSGKLAYQCAVAGKKFLSSVSVLEYKITDSTVLQKLCEKEELPYLCCEKDQLYGCLMEETEKTLVVSAGSSYLIPKNVIEKENLMIINWHNALLPRHRGRNAEAWSIYQGDPITGITWHCLTESIDAGDIIAQEEIPIDNSLTSIKLFQRQCDLGFRVFERILEPLLSDQCSFIRQAELAEEQIHFSYEVPNEGWLDIGWDFEQISRFLRAMDYGALHLLGEMRVQWQGKVYSFNRYKIEEEAAPDAVSFLDGNMIVCRDGHKIILRSLNEERNTEQ